MTSYLAALQAQFTAGNEAQQWPVFARSVPALVPVICTGNALGDVIVFLPLIQPFRKLLSDELGQCRCFGMPLFKDAGSN